MKNGVRERSRFLAHHQFERFSITSERLQLKNTGYRRRIDKNVKTQSKELEAGLFDRSS